MTTTQLKTKTKTAPKQKAKPLYDIIIIGGGPAGLTSALYALRSKLKVLIVEKMILGGTVSSTFKIDNYPGFPEGISGMELANHLQEQVKNLKPDISWGNVTKVSQQKKTIEVEIDGKKQLAKSLIIATGTQPAKLNIPGEKEFLGRGVSYCATCDGPFFKDKNIIVVGGGNSAIEEALFLTRYGKKVFVVHRRNELRADKILRDKALSNPKIYFLWHSLLTKIQGKDKVEQVVLKDLETDKNITLAADGVFIYIGSQPNSEIFKDLIKIDKQGFIPTNENMATNQAGIFAAGDIRAKELRQVVTATADGAIAAEAARKYLESTNA